MPEFTGVCDIDISPEDYVDECDEEEINYLRKILGEAEIIEGYSYKEMALDFFRLRFDLKRLILEIGKENVEKVLYETP